jgi:hypothetical protein
MVRLGDGPMIGSIVIFWFQNIKIIISVALVVIFMVDTILLIVISRSGKEVSNRYYSLHRGKGLIKMTLLKLAVVVLIYYTAFPSGKVGAVMAVVTYYYVTVIKLLSDYRKIKI